MKAAGKALADLKGQLESVASVRDAERKKLVGRWLIRNVEDPFDLSRSTRILDPAKQKLFNERAKQLARDMNLPEDQAVAWMEGAVASMAAEAEKSGVTLSLANPILPEEARPTLTPGERMAVTDYVGGNYTKYNIPLRSGQLPPPPLDAFHQALQEAFQKAKPLPTPLRVSRGMNFKDPAELNAYLQPFKQALGTDTLVPLLGYISTSTAGTPPNFVGNIEFTIIARLGLDMTPYTGGGMAMSKEKELCLNHGTLVKVHRVKPLKGGRWLVQVEQVLPAQP